MKKYLSIVVGLVMVFGTAPVYAANDVTIDPDIQIVVGDYTLLGLGAAKVIDSLVVGTSDLTVTLAPGATFSVTSADKRKLSQSGGTGITSHSSCVSSSAIAVEASVDNTSSVAVTITPSTTETCDGVTTTSSSSSGGSGGGGGGSAAVNNPNATLFTQSSAATASAPSQVQLPAQASSVAGVATTVAAIKHTFKSALKLGLSGIEVTELQKRLTEEGVYSGPITGYFGNLTLAAVKKYQANNGIDQLGNVGPATRAKLNGSIVSSAAQAPSASVEALQTQLQALQAQLLLLLSQQMELLKTQQ
jgi:hypothetical protein